MNPLWRIGSILLLAALLASLAFSGWSHLKILKLEKKLAEAQTTVEIFRAALNDQNAAVTALAVKKKEVEQRGKIALQLAKEKSKRYETALKNTKSAKASTCEEAMPVLNENVFGGQR